MTGLFFGSFNPVHNGHLAIARYILNKGYCRKVWFVVSPQNPWKEDRILLEGEKRLEIVKEAIAGDQRMEVCDVEFGMPRPSYTYQTLQLLSGKYPEEHFAIIIGGDNLQHFHLWKHAQQILDTYPLLVYPRPGTEIPVVSRANITVVDAPLTAISSTAVREKLWAGEDVSAEVPPAVRNLILKYYCQS